MRAHRSLSRASSQAAKGGGNSKEIKVGLLYVQEDSEYCRGVIGGGAPIRWCTKPPSDCKFSTHDRQKVILHRYHYYIKCPIPGQARFEPNLSTLSDSIEEDEARTLQVWEERVGVWVTTIKGLTELLPD